MQSTMCQLKFVIDGRVKGMCLCGTAWVAPPDNYVSANVKVDRSVTGMWPCGTAGAAHSGNYVSATICSWQDGEEHVTLRHSGGGASSQVRVNCNL